MTGKLLSDVRKRSIGSTVDVSNEGNDKSPSVPGRTSEPDDVVRRDVQPDESTVSTEIAEEKQTRKCFEKWKGIGVFSGVADMRAEWRDFLGPDFDGTVGALTNIFHLRSQKATEDGSSKNIMLQSVYDALMFSSSKIIKGPKNDFKLDDVNIENLLDECRTKFRRKKDVALVVQGRRGTTVTVSNTTLQEIKRHAFVSDDAIKLM